MFNIYKAISFYLTCKLYKPISLFNFILLFVDLGCARSSLLLGLLLSLHRLLLLLSRALGRVGFSGCITWAQWSWILGSTAQAQESWSTGLVAPWIVWDFPARGSNLWLLPLAARFFTSKPPGQGHNFFMTIKPNYFPAIFYISYFVFLHHWLSSFVLIALYCCLWP